MKNKAVSAIILIITLLLAGVAVFTAVRLYQLRQEAVAPNVPESKPSAAVPSSCGTLAFTLTSVTVTATATPTATATATEAPLKTCNQSCAASSDCISGLICSSGSCRNASCTGETDCTCPTATATVTTVATATATSTSTATATPTTALPDSGVSTPTIFGIGFGAILLVIAFALAL